MRPVFVALPRLAAAGALAIFGLTAGSGALAAAAGNAPPALHDRLIQLAQDYTYTSARLIPLQATQLGIPGHDGELDTPSEQNRAAYITLLQKWQKQLGDITTGAGADVPLVDRDDARLLGAQLANSLNALLVRP